ncbi:MAG: hypothetical protein H6842_02145 [Rhodospirillaceae bacterium]|nr:hypothetical protein [Rhodospirillaceae bacterium]
MRIAAQPLGRYWLAAGTIVLVAGLVWLAGSLAGADAWAALMHEMRSIQRDLHDRLADAIRAVRDDRAAVAGLIGLSFLYGLFHAAGPGHGKAVLTAYLLTHGRRLQRGVWLAVGASICQGLTAIVLVYGLVYLAGYAASDSQGTIAWAERVSFALVALLGAALALRAGLALSRSGRGGPGDDHHHDHDHGHAHGAHAGCGHAHVPTPDQVDGVRDLRTAAGVILSIGLRPCSGAVLVLVFAQVLSLPWAGAGAVAAMSAGTATAVAGLAVLAVSLRRWSLSLGGSMGRGLGIVVSCAALLGGAAICWMGVTLFTSSFGPVHPLAP